MDSNNSRLYRSRETDRRFSSELDEKELQKYTSVLLKAARIKF